MSTTLSVSLKQEDNGDRYWDVRVLSNRKKSIWGTLRVPCTSSHLERTIAAAAGSIAEQQNEMYRDRHNPDYCAKLAVEAYHDCLKKLASNEGNASKLQS